MGKAPSRLLNRIKGKICEIALLVVVVQEGLTLILCIASNMAAYSAMNTLKHFLSGNLTKANFNQLVENADNDIESSLLAFVDDNFDFFSEDILRKLVQCALQARDDNLNEDGTSKVQDSELMGAWGTIIDSVRATTAARQERAGAAFQKVVTVAQSEGPRSTATIISQLYRAGHIDKLFQELLDGAIDTCKASNNVESLEMFSFFKKVIDQNKAVEKARLAQASDAPPPSIPSTSSKTPLPEHIKAIATSSEAKIINHALPQMHVSADAEELLQVKLVEASRYLKSVIDDSRGDAAALQKRVQTDLWSGSTSFDIDHFSRVVKDNLDASQQAGYVNRVKLLQFVESRVLSPLRERIMQREKEVEDAASLTGEGDVEDGLGSFHAPRFVDESTNTFVKKIVTPEMFLTGFAKEPADINKLGKTGQRLKNVKDEVRSHQDSLRELSVSLGKHLEEHGWAVCDNFVPTDLVRRVRIETSLFAEHYEQSEIWVGKNADVGSLLSVPSVRGDKVIWMCGGHDHRAAPEGVSRVVKTKGEIEPCRLEAKTRTQMRKFGALKEIIKSCDTLVDDLKIKVKALEGIFERSDAMLANYPGEGSRFARHIDNTTGDGRRLTMLIYLNPGWTHEQGGALRLTPPSVDEAIDVYPESGRLAMFYSATIPHEVMPTYGDRHAITVWYYDSEERASALRSAQESGAAAAANRAGRDAQLEAKHFIADLMGGDDIDVNGGDPSIEELTALRNKVDDLPDTTLSIVASITGAPSTESFREGFTMLTPQDLKQMRQLFRRMGLAD